jgi:uncharacterized RDD family membrane protein YckC
MIASLLDLVIRGILAAAVFIAVAIIGSGVAQAVAYVTLFALVFGYDVLFETRAAGRTPGKRWAGLRVILPSGRRITVPVSAVRNLLRLVDFLPGFYAVGVISILVSQRNQRVGDLAAGTLVVRERKPTRPVVATGPPAVVGADDLAQWDVSAVSAQEIAAVREFLSRRPTLEPGARAGLAQQLAAGLQHHVAGGPPGLSAEQFLEAVASVKAQRQ